jgi:ABC-type Fe3+/spermidine/putrescine transport system ATPase subunit
MAVYKTPRTRFVAGFVGTNNIVDGVIATMERGSCRIETAIGQFTTATPLEGDAAAGQAVHLVVGADVITLSSQPMPTSANVIQGRLIGESFAGNVVLLVFEMTTGVELRAQVPHRVLAELDLSLQQEAYLSFEPKDALLIPARTVSPTMTKERP